MHRHCGYNCTNRRTHRINFKRIELIGPRSSVRFQQVFANLYWTDGVRTKHVKAPFTIDITFSQEKTLRVQHSDNVGRCIIKSWRRSVTLRGVLMENVHFVDSLKHFYFYYRPLCWTHTKTLAQKIGKCVLRAKIGKCVLRAKNRQVRAPCKNRQVRAPCKNRQVRAQCKNRQVRAQCKNRQVRAPCKNRQVRAQCKNTSK